MPDASTTATASQARSGCHIPSNTRVPYPSDTINACTASRVYQTNDDELCKLMTQHILMRSLKCGPVQDQGCDTAAPGYLFYDPGQILSLVISKIG